MSMEADKSRLESFDSFVENLDRLFKQLNLTLNSGVL